MTEYVIVVALIAIAAIIVVSMFGNTLRAQFAGVSKELAGFDAASQITKASEYAECAWSDAEEARTGMSKYANDFDNCGASGSGSSLGGETGDQ